MKQAVPLVPSCFSFWSRDWQEGEARLARGGEHGCAPEIRDWLLPFPDKTEDSAKSSVGNGHGSASSTAP